MVDKPGAIIIEGHVQGLSNTRSLGEKGIPVYVVDKDNCIAKYSRYCVRFFRSPDFIKDEFADFLINLAIKQGIKDWVLIPSNDHAVHTISKHKKELEKHYKIITPGIEIIDNIYDKINLIRIAKDNDVPVPVTQNFKTEFEPIIDNLKFPVIIKGRYGLSFYRSIRKKALLAENETKLREHLKIIGKKYAIEKSFTQELIPFNGINKTISFTAFCDSGEIKTFWMGIKLREHPLRFGTATFAQSIYVEECYEQSVHLLKALSYTGVCEVEYLFDPRDGDYKLIEVNARTWLWVGLARACGMDYAKMIYDFVNKISLEYPENYETGIKWINPISDTVYAFLAILKGSLHPGTYIKSLLLGKTVNALFEKNDWMPGFAYFFKLSSFIRKR